MLKINMICHRVAIAAAAVIVTLGTTASFAASDEVIAERIKSVGTVCIEGDPCAAELASSASSSGPKSPGDTYDSFCAACHTAGVGGAPKFREAADWSSRLAAGLDAVYANAINGIGAMPAKGLCMSCSDDDIKAVVDHMVEGL